MPRKKDTRLFARFDLDYADHPKIGDLSDAAFRAHVEMILYSRKYLTDGFIPKRIANRVGSEVLSELCTNDPQAPSLIANSDGSYILHGYADMNDTAEDVHDRKQRNSANGSKGGRPPKTQSVSDSDSEKETESGTQKKAETETETETSSPNGEESPRKRGTRIPDPYILTTEMRAWAAEEVPNIDVDRATRQFVDYWRAASGRTATKKDWLAAWRYWLRNERTPSGQAVKQSKAAANAAEYRRLFGDEPEGSVPALDSGVSP